MKLNNMAIYLEDIWFFGYDKSPILKEFSLNVRTSETFGFIGPNGAGKTTTIKIIMGFIKPFKGKVRIYGKRNTDDSIRIKVGYLPEKPHIYENITGWDFLRFNFMLFEDVIYSDKYWNKVSELCDKLEINYLDKKIGTYSKGMLQRFGLLQALAHDPELVILDEPMSGLDPIGRKIVRDLIFSLKNEGKTIFFSTHILPDVEKLCDRVGIIVNGKLVDIVENKTADEIEEIFMEHIKKEGIKEIY